MWLVRDTFRHIVSTALRIVSDKRQYETDGRDIVLRALTYACAFLCKRGVRSGKERSQSRREVRDLHRSTLDKIKAVSIYKLPPCSQAKFLFIPTESYMWELKRATSRLATAADFNYFFLVSK